MERQTMQGYRAIIMVVSIMVPFGVVADVATVGPEALSGMRGILGVNMAAGSGNVQANLRAIGVGQAALAASESLMQSQITLSSHPQALEVSIEQGALQQATGAISINQASGSGNIGLNIVELAFGAGTSVDSDTLLAVNGAGTTPTSGQQEGAGSYHTSLHENALNGAQGIIQINQIAGHGNIAVNRVSMPLVK
ncbi:hypothetical protein C7H85_17280 [Zobellella endophytica]|uniref:Adhesin n=1 Tax=Zobellella endophytica TaxID=2116700 RepID=A0A2P7QWP1_9GAMM|nr:hypothetical protein [Zobellella endophytica]PSJ42363.1 hypothetical protein C7H85_17280 [Zobellella endophytica]